MKNRTVNALLKENRKALQFLHSAYGFDFEAPFFIKRIEGRFTHNTVTKVIQEKLDGEYKAVLLIKPEQRWKDSFERFHIVDVNLVKFERPDRQKVNMWRFDIDGFYSVGDFEETRKNCTKFAYIIAQNTEHLKKPKEKPFDYGVRYRIDRSSFRQGVETSSDGKGNGWINRITLLSPVGGRESLTYEPFKYFYSDERIQTGVNIENYIDKSGYLIREKRHSLKNRAIDLKQKREREALKNADFSERETQLKEKLTTAKKTLAAFVLDAKTSDDARAINKAQNYLLQVFWRWERIAGHPDYFGSIAEKERYLNDIEELTGAILLVIEEA